MPPDFYGFTQPLTIPKGELDTCVEIAQEREQYYFAVLEKLRRSTVVLYTIGLYHLLEQHLALACRDPGFGVDPPSDTQLDKVKAWYKKRIYSGAPATEFSSTLFRLNGT